MPGDSKLLTTAQVARLAKITTRGVLHRAKMRGVEPAAVFGKTKVWDERAVRKLSAQR